MRPKEFISEAKMFGEYLHYMAGDDADFSTFMMAFCTAGFLAASDFGKTGIGRGVLPDPIDIPNHLGNIGPSMLIGGLVGMTVLAAQAVERDKMPTDLLQSPRRLKGALYAGSAVIGGLVNWYAESSFGESVHYAGARNYVDPKDWAYGTLSAVVSARSVAKFR